jgi:hypothetical protein
MEFAGSLKELHDNILDYCRIMNSAGMCQIGTQQEYNDNLRKFLEFYKDFDTKIKKIIDMGIKISDNNIKNLLGED